MAKKKIANVELDVVQHVDTVNIVDCASQSLSKDKKHIMLVFTTGDPTDEKTWRKLGVTLPASQAKWFVGVAFAAATMVEKSGRTAGNSVLHFPISYQIANDPKLDEAEFDLPDGSKFAGKKGKSVVGFDYGKPSEMNFVMMNGPMIMMAEAIRQNVLPRLTEAEKEELRAAKVKV